MPASLYASVELAINHYLHLDPDLREKLQPLQGKLVAIELQGFKLEMFLLVGDDAVFVLPACDREADARIIGTPLSLARLGLGEKGSGALFASGVEIQGDVDVGRQVQYLLDGF